MIRRRQPDILGNRVADMVGKRFRFLAILTIGVAIAATSGGALADKSSQGKDSRGGGSSDGKQIFLSVRTITVETADSRRLGIDWVALADGQNTLFADAGKGVNREDQDRLDLSVIPLFGQIVAPRFTADDVAPATRVGSAWVVDRTLLVAVDPARTRIQSQPEIVVLNNNFAFVMSTPAIPIDWKAMPEFAAIANLPPFRDFAAADVKVPESRAVLIGGLDTPESAEAASRVPMLGDIPALGRLFVGSAHQREKNRLVILIKPSIIATE